ncbi:MAG TPA: CGNR zinc finger domain-containing protein [Solirubrobacteraceae bacterium]|nr:CGNR zinc finger domain-containing protein [Solirubrobacteraceae bacterium]
MTSADLVVALANARAVRRPAHAPRAFFDDALADAESAGRLLEPFLGGPVDPADLRALRTLHHAVVEIVNALIDGSPPPLDALNDLAARAPATYGLERAPGGELRAVISPARPSAAEKLVLDVVREFGELEPSRLRRCERPECRLAFYDTTRSATQRWHAESPCGLRERQRRHRAH